MRTSARAIKGRGKNSVHNLPYGPRTRLIRGMYYIKYAQVHVILRYGAHAILGFADERCASA